MLNEIMTPPLCNGGGILLINFTRIINNKNYFSEIN